MGVAAQVAARGLRRYGQALLPAMPGSPGAHGSGEQPTGGPQVEIWVGGWIDISSYVRYSQGIQVTRGQPDENQKTNPSTAAFRLDNRDGRFSPRNPLGPYYGRIDRNTPCRVSVQSGNTKSYRFWGEIASWPQDWDPTGNDAWVDVQAAGILRRLGTGQAPLRSAPYLYWANPFPGRQAIAYWPMEDASGATQFAAGVSGVNPMVISGAPSLAGYSAITASDPIPSFTTGTGAYGRVPSYTPSAGSSSVSSLTCYVGLPSAGETSQVLLTIGTTGSLSWELYYTNTGGGVLGLRGRDSTGVAQCDTGTTSLAVNGVPVIVGLDFQQADANNVLVSITLEQANGTLQGFASAESATFTMGRLVSVRVAPSGTLTGTAVGHVAVSTVNSTAAFPDYQGNLGELASVRFQRLCNYININSHIVFANLNALGPNMGPQHSGAFLDILQECVDADGGIMFELMDRLGLGYRLRDSFENQTSAVLALDYSQAQLFDVPKPVDDDTYTRNDITVTRLNGSFTRATQTSGTLNTQTPPAGVGTYATSITMNVEFDSQTADEAGRLLHLGTIAEPRFPSIGLQLARTEITSSPVLRPNALALMPGDRLTVANPPAWLPPDTISALVRGYTETFDQFLHHLQFNTSPESGYRVAVSDDPVFGRADTDGSTLATPALATDSVLQVATTNSTSPLWTTNVSDYPFDLTVGGERVTAWACGQPLGAIDGTFESGVTGWTPTGCTLAAAPGFAHSGSQSGLMTVTGSPTQAFIRPDTSHNAPVTVGTSYQASMWVYSPVSLGNVVAAVDWLTSGEAYISTSSGTTVTLVAGLWTPLTVTANAVATAAFARGGPTISGSPANGTQLWVDDYAFVAPSSFQSSPQTLAVLRSVNGVVKPQAQGTSVQLYQPAIATM